MLGFLLGIKMKEENRRKLVNTKPFPLGITLVIPPLATKKALRNAQGFFGLPGMGNNYRVKVPNAL
jgi:hypothetical protein